ncbi:MAG: protein-L-isoaspartate O-methyltransferase family protein, partial [Pseudomonadota bacterium]
MQTYSFTITAAEQPLLQAMLDGQLRPTGVSDHAVLASAQSLPRGPFTLGDVDGAYTDSPCNLTPTRSLLPARVAARLVQALGLTEESRVLVLAAGTGYEAALLAPMVASVVACEDDEALQGALRRNLRDIKNAEALPNGPLRSPASSQPFTHVLVAAPFEVLPSALLQALPSTIKLAGVRVSESGIP